MKRIKNADINFKLNPKRINLNNFSMKLYTVNSEAYFFIKDQDNVVSVEREATIYDDPEVIISGGTVAVDYYLPLDWSELVQLGEGVLNYRCINNIDDPFFPDLVYNQVVEDTTAYYIDSDIHIDPADDKNLIERVVELESNLAVETADREDADVFLSGAVDTEIARAISAETELSERIDAIESGASEALDAEIERAISAETALQDAIDDEEARAIAIENAIRQDLTDESELRSSADTAMWTAINDETTRATSAETAIENKVDVETLRAIGVENAISGDLQTYKATNNAALQAETTRATSAETALQTAIQNEATARANADAALGTRIDNISSASTAAIEAEEARAREAESGLTTALQNEVTRATSAETQLSNSLTTEINRATSAETAIDNKIDAETLRAIGVENTISGNLETYKATANAALQAETTRATSAETALQTAIDNEATARANADTALQTAITNEESRAREAESAITNALNAEVTRATGAENALDTKIDAETTRATAAEAALDAKIDQEITDRTADVDAEEARAKGVENALSGAIDTLDAKFIDDAKYEMSGQTHVINFYNGNTVKATIDCTDFLVDGMIDNVYIENGYLVIDFNTASGKQDIRIPLTDIFNPANYYTKSETSGATEIATALALKLNISDFNTYSGAVDTLINSKASQSTVDALSGTVTGHTSDSVIHVTSNDKEKWNKVDDKADTTALTAVNNAITAHTADTSIHLTSGNVQTQIDNSISGKADSSDVYLKSETSGATEIATALSGKQATLVSGENIKTINNQSLLGSGNIDIQGGGGGGITSGEVQTMIDESISGKANSSDVYLKSETSGATEISTALNAKLDATAYTPTDLSNYYTKSETSGATEIATALSGKVDSSSVVTAVTSASTDSEIPTAKAVWEAASGGGGKAIEAGTNISITTGETADTINCTLPIYSGGTNSIAIGHSGNTINGYYNLLVGKNNKVNYSGDENILVGIGNKTTMSNNCAIFGEYNIVDSAKANCFVAGSNNYVNNSYETAFGQYCKSTRNSYIFGDSGNTLFSVGNGTADNARHNAFEIRQNGDIYITLNDQDVKLQDHLGGGGSSYTAGDGIDITNDVISVTGKVDTLTYNTYTAATDAALASKQTTLTAGTGIDITSNVISVTGGTGGGISSAECQTMIISATTPIYQAIEDNEEVTAAALNVLNEALSDKQDVSGMTAYTTTATTNTLSGQVSTNTTNIATVSAATASNTTALGGLSLVKLTQAQYDALATKDNNTLYVIVG